MKFELYPPSNHLASTAPESSSISTMPVLSCYGIGTADSNTQASKVSNGSTQQPAASHSSPAQPQLPVTKSDDETEQISSDGSSKGLAMPIDKLKVHGNQLNQQRMSPPQSPHPPSTAATLRRYEFIRRSLPRSEKPTSPTFVIEGKKVSHKLSLNADQVGNFDESKLDFDPIAYLEGRMNPLKSSKPVLPPKPKTETSQSVKGSSTSVTLPVLHIEGPGFSHQFRSKSSSLPGDDQPAEIDDMTTEPSAPQENIWCELENLDQRHHRAIKKNNFFTSIGTRVGEDHSELCVDNSNKSNKTITLHLQTSQEKQRPVTNGFAVVPSTTATNQQLPKTSKSSRDKPYKSATNLAASVGSRPLFHSVSSYINFNKRSAGLYHSEQYLDSTRLDGPLKPLENHPKRPSSKKLITKYSDMEIQRELNDFFKIRPVK